MLAEYVTPSDKASRVGRIKRKESSGGINFNISRIERKDKITRR